MQQSRFGQIVLWSLLLAGNALFAAAPFPGEATGPELIVTQQKVDALFEQGDYERALFIYRHELAPLGDKYAQYMVGYMYLAGKGVDKDAATAAAWFRLAAERSEQSYLRESLRLDAALGDAQRQRSARLFAELCDELGDAALLSALIERDLSALGSAKLGNSFAGPAAVHSGGSDREAIEARIRARLGFVENALPGSEFVSPEQIERFRNLKARAERELRESGRRP